MAEYVRPAQLKPAGVPTLREKSREGVSPLAKRNLQLTPDGHSGVSEGVLPSLLRPHASLANVELGFFFFCLIGLLFLPFVLHVCGL